MRYLGAIPLIAIHNESPTKNPACAGFFRRKWGEKSAVGDFHRQAGFFAHHRVDEVV